MPLRAIVGAGVVALCVIGGAVVTVAALATRDGGNSEQAAVSAPPSAQTTSASPGPATDHPQAPDQPANPDGPPTLQVGEGAEDSVGSLAVTAAQRYTEPSSRFGERPENDVFLQVTIHAEATGDEVYRVSASDFYVRDSGGRQYDYGGGELAVRGGRAQPQLRRAEPWRTDHRRLGLRRPGGAVELVFAPNFGRSQVIWQIP